MEEAGREGERKGRRGISTGYKVATCYFADVNECSLPLQLCHPDANCTDIEDGYICTCKTGYSGNGTDCISKLDFSFCNGKKEVNSAFFMQILMNVRWGLTHVM